MSKSTKPISAQLADNVIPLNLGRVPSKTDQLIELLRRAGGASIEEISLAFGGLPYSSRAKLTGLRKAGGQFRCCGGGHLHKGPSAGTGLRRRVGGRGRQGAAQHTD